MKANCPECGTENKSKGGRGSKVDGKHQITHYDFTCSKCKHKWVKPA